MLSRLHWRKFPRTPLPPLPDNDATRLLQMLQRGGYVVTPRKPTPQMIAAGDAAVWTAMLAAWEKELKRARRLGVLSYARLPPAMEER